MMRLRTLFSLAAVCTALALPARSHADVFLADFLGYDYEDPDINPQFGGPGDWYNAIGLVTEVNPAFVTTTPGQEYTFQFFNLWPTLTETAGDFVFIYYTSGRVRIFEDNTTTATFGVNPPNATAPSTFTDGTLVLGASVNNFVITLDTVTGDGSFDGEVTFDEGSQLSNIPPGQRSGWTFAGLTSGPGTGTPEGYDHQVDGEIRVQDPTPATPTTWGKLKATYQ
jgi:hypothetical protein